MYSKVTFKKAEPTDAPLLAATRQKAWAATYRGIYPDEMIDQYDLERYTAKDRERLQDPKRETYLLLDGEACVGYFSYGANARGKFCLYSIYLLPEYQRKGIGRAMMRQVASACREGGEASFYCDCQPQNVRARRFYEAMGGNLIWFSPRHQNRAEDSCRYEFDLAKGEPLWQAKPQ